MHNNSEFDFPEIELSEFELSCTLMKVVSHKISYSFNSVMQNIFNNIFIQ